MAEPVSVVPSVDSKVSTTLLMTVVRPIDRFSFELEASLTVAGAVVAPVSPVAVALAVSLSVFNASDSALARPSVALAVVEGNVVFTSTCLLISLGK